MTPKDGDKPLPLLQHLADLRRCFLNSLAGIFLGMVVAWFLRRRLLAWLLLPLRPYLPPGEGLTVLSLTEAFLFYVKLSFFGGIFLASPWVLWQVWRFVAPGLYAHEKRVLLGLIAFSTVCFLAGGYFGYRVLMPLTCRFLVDVSRDFHMLVTTTSYLSFFLHLILGVALTFELPVFTLLLARLGIVSARSLWKFWRIAVVASFVIAAVITPSGDMITQAVLAVPLIGLYFVSVLVAGLFGKRPQTKVATRQIESAP